MIEQITYSAQFASSGFTLERQFQPLKGITAVVGPNGSGKTASTIEAVRYLIYGSAARRGKSEDYKNTTVSGALVINGERFEIERGPKAEKVKDSTGAVVAVGAAAVNAYMVEKMGYPLDVFDVCNASTQGQTQLFTNLRPADRKRMIDKVVGLTSYEVVEKACRTEATSLRREVEALSKALVVPVGPDCPSDYQPSDEYGAALNEARALHQKYRTLENRISNEAPPAKPSMPAPSETDIRLLRDHEDARRSHEYRRNEIEAKLRDARMLMTHTKEELDKAKARLEAKRLIDSLGPKPSYTQAQLDEARDDLARYEAGQSVTCPNCQHHFDTGGEPPAIDSDEIRRQQGYLNRWDGHTDVLPDGEDLTSEQINAGYAAIIAETARKGLKEEQDALPVLEDRSDQLSTLVARQSVWNGYVQQQQAWEQRNAASIEAQKELDLLDEPLSEDELTRMSERLAAFRIFENLWSVYDRAKIIFDKQSAEIEDKRKLAEEFKKGGDAIADARAVVKANLAPAMTRVASKLVYDMTNGAIPSIFIDEDMEITVNGQRVETLSGGGVTVVNLALRVALGMVLVGDTFPVFMGDEMEADIDEERREAIAQALVGLKKRLQQIILVTHRGRDIADHVHDLVN